MEEYKNTLQITGEVQARFAGVKPYFAFLVNLFNVSVVGKSCPARQPFVTGLSGVEMKLTEMQEDLPLKIFSQFHSTVEFWPQVPEINTQNSKHKRRPTAHFCIWHYVLLWIFIIWNEVRKIKNIVQS